MRQALRFLCTLSAFALVPGGLAADAVEPSSRPRPWVFSDPLRSEALFASGYAAPWLSAESAWVSSDGKRVAFFTREPSSAEGISRTLVVKDVDTDAVVFEKTLFSEEESLQHGIALERLARSRAREALAALPRNQWAPLAHLDLSSHEREFFSDACFEKQLHPKRSAALEALKVTYQEPRVQIWRRGKSVLDRKFPSWRLKQEQCPHASPSWLNRVFSSQLQGVVLLELGFCGSDLCSEPATTFHALRIPSGKRQAAGNAQVTEALQVPSVHYETEGDVWRTLYVTGFPAISADNSQVLLAEVLPDGEHGAPNLLLTIRRPQTNEVLWRYSLLEAEESASVRKAAPPLREALDQKVMERIRVANEQLRGTQWVPLVEQAIQPVVLGHCPVDTVQTLRLGGMEMTFHQGRIILKRDGEDPPVERSVPALDSSEKGTCATARSTFLDTAYVAPNQKTVVLRLATCVDDSCPKQGGGYFILQLPE
ncbi:hypothetical protein ACN28S_58645 [Cystobacter fuscus]